MTLAYDIHGRKTSEVLAMDGASRTLTSGWDANGVRTALTYPDGHAVAYHRDGRGRLFHAFLNTTSHLVYPTYNADGSQYRLYRLDGSTGAWGLATGFAYDPAGRLSALSHDLAGTGHDTTTSFTRNPASQIASLTRSNDAAVHPELVEGPEPARSTPTAPTPPMG